MTRRGYAICQIAGWSAWTATSMVYLELAGPGLTVAMAGWLAVESLFGFAISHAFRAVVRRGSWARLPLRRLAPRVVLAATVQAGLLDAVLAGASLISHADGPLPLALLAMFWLNFTILYLAWSFLYFGLHWLDRSRNAERAELRYLRSQLNPHFLFNALNGIRALVVEDPARAQHAITGLARLLRSVLSSTSADTVSLSRELEVVDDYLAVEAIRLDERLRVTREIDPEVLEQAVPAMLVQTLVENGIKHGIARRSDGGEVAVRARRNRDTLEISVANTAAEEPRRASDDGTGLRNALDRLRLMFGDRATLVLDRSDVTTTVARVSLPLGPRSP